MEAPEEVPVMPAIEILPLAEEAPIPTFSLDQPLPVSALDGFMLDDSEVINALGEMDTNSLEAQADILEAVEVLSAPQSIPEPEAAVIPPMVEPAVPESVVTETQEPESVSAPPQPEIPIAPPAVTPAEAPAPAKPKSGISHGFNF
jgi:hypothetical protein